MKKLTNKKGFTLIEMLVVIAIIAVLVAIIIPVISSSTTKAAAATNAANLRAVKAEATTELLSGSANTDGYVTVAVNNGTTTLTLTNVPEAKSCGTGNTAISETTPMVMSYNTTTKEIKVAYGTYTINDLAEAAETGELPAGTYTAVTDGTSTQFPAAGGGNNQQGGGA